MIINLIAAVLGRRLPDRYVGRHRALEPVALGDDDESVEDLLVQQDETITDGGPTTLVRPSTPA